MCDPVSATLALGAAGTLGGGLLSGKAQDEAAAETIKQQAIQAEKQAQLGRQNLKIAGKSAEAVGGGSDVAAATAREQAKTQALAANAPTVDVVSPNAGHSSFVQSELNKAVGAEAGRAADEDRRANDLAAFGDRMQTSDIATGIAGSRIASNNNASQFLDSMPVYSAPGSSPLGDILSGVGGVATLAGGMGMGIPGLPGGAKPKAAAGARGGR
jgi:hypothetical protein